MAESLRTAHPRIALAVTQGGRPCFSPRKATQTFVVQLSCAAGFYLPTEKGVRGGHYSTEVGSVFVGPEGGQVL
ncbi:MAG: hypothetical protein NTW87_19185, partial [Planctomycetota bacterium]|nr:hypothetical protein [Planctomycetota bacterium]